MDKIKYVKWYNLARTIINDDYLIPERHDKEILKLISKSSDEWLAFAPKDITMEELKNSVDPNIYFEIIDDNRGIIGLTFNTVRSVDKIKNILEGYCKAEKEELLKKF